MIHDEASAPSAPALTIAYMTGTVDTGNSKRQWSISFIAQPSEIYIAAMTNEHMTPRFSRGEYWILESLVEARTPVRSYAGPREAVEERFNKKWHGLSATDLIGAIQTLLDQRLIEECKGRAAKTSLLDELRGTGPKPHEMVLQLTAEGGRQWEAFALPDWPAYIDFGMRLPPGKDGFWSCAACAADRSTLERYLEALPSIGTKVNMTTLQWSQLTPWQATYWKTLPTGHRVKFKAQESEEILDWSEIPYTDHRTLHPRWYRWD